MTDKNEQVTSLAKQPAKMPAEGAVRRPYRAPVLRYLGSVRSLTLGGTAGSRKDFPAKNFKR